MNNLKRLSLVGTLMLLLAVPAIAQTPEASILPVTEPLDVGGTILQPGTYTIRVIPSFADRNKIQVLNQNEEVVATALTVPHPLEPNEEVPNTTFLFYPAGEGAPRALRTWFAQYPDASQGGHDIVYEESRARQLARLAASDVVYYPEDVVIAEVTEEPELHVITPEAEVETYTYIAPTPQVETQTTTVIETPAPMVSATETNLEMPATASNLPLLALLGVLSLAGAAVMRFRS